MPKNGKFTENVIFDELDFKYFIITNAILNLRKFFSINITILHMRINLEIDTMILCINMEFLHILKI